jgi:hypothetical protein
MKLFAAVSVICLSFLATGVSFADLPEFERACVQLGGASGQSSAYEIEGAHPLVTRCLFSRVSRAYADGRILYASRFSAIPAERLSALLTACAPRRAWIAAPLTYLGYPGPRPFQDISAELVVICN